MVQGLGKICTEEKGKKEKKREERELLEGEYTELAVAKYRVAEMERGNIY